jgi:hypothetical protein
VCGSSPGVSFENGHQGSDEGRRIYVAAHGQLLAVAPTALIPVLGPRTLAHLEEYLRSIELSLDEEQYRRLEEASVIRLGPPHDDVAAALNSGVDGDRTLLLETSPVPVI